MSKENLPPSSAITFIAVQNLLVGATNFRHAIIFRTKITLSEIRNIFALGYCEQVSDEFWRCLRLTSSKCKAHECVAATEQTTTNKHQTKLPRLFELM